MAAWCAVKTFFLMSAGKLREGMCSATRVASRDANSSIVETNKFGLTVNAMSKQQLTAANSS